MKLALALIFAMVFYVYSNQVRAATNPLFQTIHIAPGCEDFAFDPHNEAPRLILSCDDRRQSLSRGSIFELDLKTHVFRELPILGIHLKSFHPHGISISQRDTKTFLYVISHQWKQQSFEKKNFTDVLVFEIRKSGLNFVENLGGKNQKMFASPNDLVVLENRDIFMTNPSSLNKSVLHYSHLLKKWSVAATGYLYPNGIHFKDSKVFLTSSADGKFYSFDYQGSSTLRNRKLLHRSLGVIDNITQGMGQSLYFSGANNIQSFLRHFRDPTFMSPSRAYRIKMGRLEKLRSPTLNRVISAPSVAFEYKGRLYLGQPFEDFIVMIPNPSWESVEDRNF